MLNAINSTKEIQSLLGLNWKEIERLKKNSYFCPSCDQLVMIKNSQMKRPHFAHYKRFTCSAMSEGETEEHLLLKEVLANWCEKENIDYQIEPFLKHLNQRPDLLIGKIVLEVQCSPLKINRLIERTNNYVKHGYTPIWILGKKLCPKNKFTELTKKFCYFSEKIGFYFWSMDYEQKEISLSFHLEEDWSKHLFLTKKKWVFYSNHLEDILDYPKQAKIYTRRIYKLIHLVQPFYNYLSKSLVKRREEIREIQSIFYVNRLHILALPFWFYYPGIRLFGCKHSDLLLKLEIYHFFNSLKKEKFTDIELIEKLQQIMNQSSHLFCEFANIKESDVKVICLNQLLNHLVTSELLIKEKNQWTLNLELIKELRRFSFDKMKNETFMTATPIKNMIR